MYKANELTESQKIDVINTFDKAETVKEVKLVYETLFKSFETKKTIKTKTQIKESLGFASNAAGNSTKKDVINNVDTIVARFKFLAGLE